MKTTDAGRYVSLHDEDDCSQLQTLAEIIELLEQKLLVYFKVSNDYQNQFPLKLFLWLRKVIWPLFHFHRPAKKKKILLSCKATFLLLYSMLVVIC